jgi:proline iminopeptidase
MPQKWPESINRCFKHINPNVYVYMQGHEWIYWKTRLLKLGCQSQTKNLTVPTLSIGSKYDTMDPEHMKWIANEVQNGRFLFS